MYASTGLNVAAVIKPEVVLRQSYSSPLLALNTLVCLQRHHLCTFRASLFVGLAWKSCWCPRRAPPHPRRLIWSTSTSTWRSRLAENKKTVSRCRHEVGVEGMRLPHTDGCLGGGSWHRLQDNRLFWGLHFVYLEFSGVRPFFAI